MKSESAFNGIQKYTTTGRRKTKAELSDAYYAQFRYKCPNCGTNVYIGKEEKRLCRNCHIYVWKDKKVEFKDKLLSEIRRNNMQEKIIDEMKHWGEEEDYTQNNLDAYEMFVGEIEGIVNYPDDYTKEQILVALEEELESLKEELK